MASTFENCIILSTKEKFEEYSYKCKLRVSQLLACFNLKNEHYECVRDQMNVAFNEGLKKAANYNKASLKMIPSFVRSLPDGTVVGITSNGRLDGRMETIGPHESGEFITLNFGSIVFKINRISIFNKKIKLKSKIYIISNKLKSSPGNKFFMYIADCLSNFIAEQNLNNEPISIGITFSFPIDQQSLSSGKLITWTKDYSCSDVVGKDVIELIKLAIEEKENIGEVVKIALINDGVGTLVSCAHHDENCRVGVIIGTGTNACYMESLENIETWTEDKDSPSQVIINTEWGSFGLNEELAFITTIYDDKIDENSLNPGKQKYEKMISGMYMGELCREVLVKLCEQGLFLTPESAGDLYTPHKFLVKYVSLIESDFLEDTPNTIQVLENLNIYVFKREDCEILQYVCSAISSRAAYLTAAGISCILNRMNISPVTVGITGSLYRYHPKFHDLMAQKIKELSPNIKCTLMLSENGCSKGAALVVAIAKRIEENRK